MRWVPVVPLLIALVTVGLVPAAAQVRKPQFADLLSVFPSGGQRGKSLTVTLRGKYLHDPSRVLLSGAGVEPRAVRGVSEEEAAVDLVIAPDAAPGVRAVRLVTRFGLSDPGWFVVGAHPEILEKEPNPSPGEAQTIVPPVVVNGRLPKALDVDCYSFGARAGERLVLAVSAYQMDAQVASGRFLDATLTVYDARGRVVAANEDQRTLDPGLVFTPPADGRYVAEVRDMGYQGDERGVYRLSVTPTPYPVALFPAGGRRGARVDAQVIGLAVNPGTTVAVTPAADAPPGPEWVQPEGAACAVPFIVGELPEAIEAEPNDELAAANAVTADTTINGRLEKEGDSDLFMVQLQQGEGVIVDVTAGRILRSPVDMEARVLDGTGQVLQENDDSVFTYEATANRRDSLSGDPRLEFVARESGRYYLELRDLGGRGGADCIYRATVTRRKPGFDLVTWYDNPSIKGPGGSAVVFALLRRWGGYLGPVSLRVRGLPDGYLGSEAFIPAATAVSSQQSTVLTITAPPAAKVGDLAPFWIEGQAEIDGKPFRVRCEPRAHLGQNSDHSIFRTTESCVACVIPPDEWRIHTDVTHLTGSTGQTVIIPLSIERVDGYGGAISVLPMAGNRISLGPPVTIPAGVSVYKLLLKIPEDLVPGDHTFVVCRPIYGDLRSDRPHTSTRAIRLTVTPNSMSSAEGAAK